MNLCDMIYVLNYGKIIAAGKPNEIQRNEQVIEAYLGKEGGLACCRLSLYIPIMATSLH